MEWAPLGWSLTYAITNRYWTQGDAYIVCRSGHQPAEAAKEYATDHPNFTGLLIVIFHVMTKPAIGINRRVAKEHQYWAELGTTRRMTKK